MAKKSEFGPRDKLLRLLGQWAAIQHLSMNAEIQPDGSAVIKGLQGVQFEVTNDGIRLTKYEDGKQVLNRKIIIGEPE